jgi:hypothetical protein
MSSAALQCSRLACVLSLLALAAPRAHAQICSPLPVNLPGLLGAPDWFSGTSTQRTDLNEPRWAAAPMTSFDSDVVGSLEGAYRIMYDPTANQLVVSMQALTDLGNQASNADAVYFGLSTNAAATTAHAVRVDMIPATGAADPKTASLGFTRYEFNSGTGWTQLDFIPSGTPPAWMKNVAAWVEPGSGADWALNFRVSLVDAGLLPGDAYKLALGLHMSNELGAGAVDLTTPDVGVSGGIADLVTSPHTPTSWTSATAANGGCPDGISLSGMQIGTRNTPVTAIDTSPGAINRLFATPSIPASIPLQPNLFQANFRVAQWGSIADAHAPWTSVPGANAVINGPPNAADYQTSEFVCPPNGGGQTCGMPTPAQPHQCMLVELSKVPSSGANVRFTRAAAYRNMRFQDLSSIKDSARISTIGLAEVLHDSAPRELYLYVDPTNMPEHGDKPLWLKTRTMESARRVVEEPPPVATKGRIAGVPGAVSLPTPVSERPQEWLAYSDHRLLKLAWPTYEVHVYYALGARKWKDKEYLRLEPMYPFVYYFAHEGALYGFAQRLLAGNVQLQELQPNLYKATVPNESTFDVTVEVSAEERPLHDVECPEIQNIKDHKTCACALLGARSAPTPLELLLGLALGLVLGARFLRRRR